MKTRDKTALLLFERAVIFSQQKRITRLFRRPFFTLSRSAVLRWFYESEKGKTFLVFGKTFWGKKMLLPVQGKVSIFQWGFISGSPEIELTRFMIRNLKEGNIFFDAGAHYGFYSLLASWLVGDTGSVHSFEPTPKTFMILAKNVFGQKNITINQAAVWHKQETIDFTDFGDPYRECNTWMSKTVIGRANKNREKKIIRVETVTLDDYVRGRKIIPHFIKLDIEGAERYALQGMKKILGGYSPLLAIEFHGGKNWTENNDGVFNFLRKFRYQPYYVKEGNLLKYDGEKQFDYANLIFKKEH